MNIRSFLNMSNIIQISVDSNKTISFAMQQNHVPIVRKLSIKNLSDAELTKIKISITTDPAIADEWTSELSSIQAMQEYILDSVPLHLSASKLFELTERINGSMIITVSDVSGIIAQETQDISFLSYDHWSGASTYPEFLSAFITPNYPYITEIIKNAGPILADWTGSSSFTGYQSKNPNNVKSQMAAIYGALQKENIDYCMPPASFEEDGQKVRLGATIKEQKIGTCLDLALLYASCLEAAGLHPMIIVIKGHAFAGCWLEEESFAECVQDDVSLITKRIASGINEICIVETTAFTVGKNIGFDNAILAAENHLQEPEKFIYLVDVKRSRGSGIRPIPQKRADGLFSFDIDHTQTNSMTDKPKELEVLGKMTYVDSIEFSKQQMWERKLLDLSLRNTLLSFRVTKNAIQLLVNSVYELSDALQSGEEFQIMHRPHDMKNSPRDSKMYEALNNESIWHTLIKSEFQSRRIRTYIDELSLGASISALYRTAKSNMEESGANTLYLALGFLKWYETDISEKPRYAPLVMVPVDIIRKSAQRGYVFRLRDEEPQFNVTLLEKLRMDFGLTVTGLDPLPVNEQGIDIKLIFHIVRQMIMDKPRWDVEELAFMGIFSFTQFIMWNDIRNRIDDLRQNKIVSSLVSGQMEWSPDTSFLSPEALDDQIQPSDLAVPISADSSQLAAIHAAGAGHSFVLHGPPGTGKSQTITNIIANALYHGKSVLFVAEKMAALNIVEKRLSTIGLGDFCLELHSNKARKKDVLDQLEKSLNVGRIKSPESYQRESDNIFNLRQELNGIVRELHKPRSFGFSLYEAISYAEQYATYPDCMIFSNEQISLLTSEKYSQWYNLCEQLMTTALSCNGVSSHALSEYKNPTYSQNERFSIEGNIKNYSSALIEIRQKAEKISAALKLGELKTYTQYRALANICAILTVLDYILPSLLSCNELSLYHEKINLLCACGQRRDTVQNELLTEFSEQILEFDSATALLQWNQADASWFLPKTMGKSKISKAVKLFAINTKAYDKSRTPEILKLVSEYAKNNSAVKELSVALEGVLGALLANGNWEQIESMTMTALNLQKAMKSVIEDKRLYNSAIQYICESFGNNADRFKIANQVDWKEYISLVNKIKELESELSRQFLNTFEQWHNEQDWVSAVTEKAGRWLSGLSGLRDYCSYLRAKADIEAAGLHTICNALENGLVSENELMGSFIKNLTRACAMNVIDSTPELNSFHGDLFSQKIDKFKTLIKQYEMLTKQELVARLSAQIPVLNTGVSGSSEIGILQRTIKSNGRMKPVRKLFEEIPNLLRKLAPCMLMSPLSVAQYLDPKFPAFDLIVFDEASQLPTSEAVGVIARGKELIVVGDPKQLPPTSFFTSNQVDEENYDKEDLESVLDDCLALSMPQEHLRWHYRSRHESLIAFSNRNYYENKLFTFPSPNNMASKVRLIPVEGFYDRGKTKQNKAEAEAIVREIIRRLSDPVLKNRSIGVVTFSSVQQNLIADMLEIEFSKHPELDEIANNADEPIFIKNLENVQGDERDVILFSIGYGPDAQGRVALNFGPLNREGGWRRLNVAVSRARYEMMIFSVLKPEQIDLNRTGSDGLVGLKTFLEFAARGIMVLPDTENTKDITQCAIDVIANKIRSVGYTVHTNIGCSGYRVDIGIVHPDNPETYVLGILCDGMNYNNGGTTLDRNNTQDAVLQGLGWHLHRIWILDWWDNSEKELDRIKSSIETATDDSTLRMDTITNSEKPVITQVHNFEKIEDTALDELLNFYELAQLSQVAEFYGDYDYFSSYESTNIIIRQIESVLDVEAPINKEVLCRRVLGAWGISRIGARIGRRFDDLFSLMRLKTTKLGNATFLWKAGTEPEQYNEFRMPSSDDKTRRNLEHISPEEIASTVKHILNQQIGLLKEDLEREVSRIFGFARCTEAMQKCISAGIEIAVRKKWAISEGDRICAYKL